MADLTRRAFLQISAASGGALAATLGIKKIGKLIPYVIPPENIKPGTWVHYATTCRECPAGCGMHVRHRDGRAVKCEGNPDHPISHGGLCARGQSAVQGLYDPDRIKTPLRREGNKLVPATWEEALSAIAGKLKTKGASHLLASDLQTGALDEVMTAFSGAFNGEYLRLEPVAYQGLGEQGGVLAGQDARDLWDWQSRDPGPTDIPHYRLDRADFIFSLGADFLETWLSPVEFAYGFAKTRTITDGKPAGTMIYVGPRYSMTAANADRFIPLEAHLLPQLALAILGIIVNKKLYECDDTSLEIIKRQTFPLTVSGISQEQLDRLAMSFAKANAPIALPGVSLGDRELEGQIAVASMLLNLSMWNRTTKQKLWEAPGPALQNAVSSQEFFNTLRGIDYENAVVLLHNANIAYALPHCQGLFKHVGMIVQMTTLPDETSELAHWVLPIDSPLESLGDYEPYQGVRCLMQPTTARLYDSRLPGDIFLALADAAGQPLQKEDEAGNEHSPTSFQQWLKERWEAFALEPSSATTSAPAEQDNTDKLDAFWQDSLRNGFALSSSVGGQIKFSTMLGYSSSGGIRGSFTNPMADYEKHPSLWLYPSIMLFDGRLANRGWLQEAPDPTTSNTWGSWLDMHPTLATKLGVNNGDIVRVSPVVIPAVYSRLQGDELSRFLAENSVDLPVRVTTDVVENTVAAALGQGHWAKGLKTAAGRGVNMMAFLSPDECVPGKVEIVKTGKRGQIFCTSATQDQKHRELMQWVAADKLTKAAPKAREFHLPLPQGYSKATDIIPAHPHRNHRWGMVIDLNRCIGCGACAVACQAENNIAVVGPDEVAKGREMSWLKIVPYRQDDDRNSHGRDAHETHGQDARATHREDARATAPARIGFLPMLCQHCDSAPCESVCPVYASVNSEEGLNLQVYNRCVGTRYCSNNCPYKVRRFNWFDHDWPTPTDWQLNPDVTVRSRGVMEKCTFCLQRIREAQYRAKRDNRPLADGEIKPACAQSCPTRAIVFGDLMLKDSRVYELMAMDPRRYQVLGELNTKTAVVYLKRVRSS